MYIVRYFFSKRVHLKDSSAKRAHQQRTLGRLTRPLGGGGGGGAPLTTPLPPPPPVPEDLMTQIPNQVRLFNFSAFENYEIFTNSRKKDKLKV